MQALSWHNLRHFVATLSNPLRKRGLAGPTQETLNNENLVRLGALAAEAVHDLCSPLTTMAVVVDELKQQLDAQERRDVAENLCIVSAQIEACRHILSKLVVPDGGRAGLPGSGAGAALIPAVEVNEERAQLGPRNGSVVARSTPQLFSERV